MCASLFASQVIATNLNAVYQAAKSNDPALAAAAADYGARRQAVPQARSVLLPNLTVTATSSFNRREFPVPPQIDLNPNSPTFGQRMKFSGQDFNQHGFQIQGTLNLINLPSWFDYRSAKSRTVQARWEYSAARQELILRVAQTYLDVLRAQDRLESSQAEEATVKWQLEQVQQHFAVGLVTITDVLDSTAVYNDAVVSRTEAEGDHDTFFETLSALTGERYAAVDRLAANLPIVNPHPFELETWVRTALATNFKLQAALQQLQAAQQTVRARLAEHLPVIRATGSQTHFVTGGSNFLGGKTDQRTVAVQIQIPIYQGGFTHSRAREARFRARQARQQLTRAERTVTRETRSMWRAVATDVVRVAARLKAIKAAESVLEANQTGYRVGTRNIVEVLQAQQRLFATHFNYADSRYRYVLDLVRLKRLAGTLSEKDLADLNNFTDPNHPVERLPVRQNYRTTNASGG